MTARKKSPRKSGKTARQRARDAIQDGLRDLERRLPSNLRSAVRDLRSNLVAVQQQMERTLHDRETRWRRLETQIRRDTARLLRRLEKAVSPGSGKVARAARTSRPTRRKTTARKRTTRRRRAAR